MAFHRIGDSIFSDEELSAGNERFFNIFIPGLVVAIGEYFLYGWLSNVGYFVVHTTTAKVIYLSSGVLLFGIGFYYRKLILATIVILGVCCIFFLIGAVIWQWLSA